MKAKMAKDPPKEYESKTTYKLNDGKIIEAITLLSYTPSDGGKGYIVKIRERKE